MDNLIIILGGMGPQASVRLHELLLQESRKFHNGSPDEYPGILHVSVPVPDFIESKAKYNVALRLLQDVCAELPLDKASAIGIACNTAHLMTDALGLPSTSFISMIKEVTEQLSRQRVKKVGLLASPHTIKTRLYHQALETKGMEVVSPDTHDLQVLNSVIHDVINGIEPESLRPLLTKLAKRMEEQGADIVLLGCTELPLVGIDASINSLDSLRVLASALVQQHYMKSCII